MFILRFGLSTAFCAAALLAGNPEETSTPHAVQTVPSGLLKKLHHPDPRVRAAAATSIGALGPQAEPAAGALCVATVDPIADVRTAALAALAKVQPPLHVQLKVILTERNPAQGVEAIRSIGAMKDKGKAALPVLCYLEHLAEKAMPERDPGTGPRIIEFKEHNEPGAATAMAIAAADLAAFNVLTEAVLSTAADDKALTRELAGWMLRTHRSVKRRLCVAAIGRTKHAADAVPALIVAGEIESSTDPATEVAIIHLLGDIGRPAKKAVPLLEHAKHSPVAEIRDAATDALDHIRGDH